MLGKEEIVSPALDELKEHYQRIITLLGEDAEREGLLKTPERVAKAMLSLTKGYFMDPHEVLRSAKFKEEYSQMVIVKDIDFFSLCEHHMLPFYGKAHVAYIPNGYITGLSKIARVVDIFSHRLQVQERMTLQIKECIQETLNPLGVMVVVEAKHMCMQMRGVEKQNSITTTSDFTGAFNQAKTREEFMNLIQHLSIRRQRQMCIRDSPIPYFMKGNCSSHERGLSFPLKETRVPFRGGNYRFCMRKLSFPLGVR